MQNPYFYFDNPLIVNELIKNGIGISKLMELYPEIEKLKAYVDKLDDEVKAEVIRQLGIMEADGTLSALLENIKDDRQNTIFCRRNHRQIYVTGKHNYHYNATTANFAYWCNSAIRFWSEGTWYIAGVFPHHNATTNETEVRLYDSNLNLIRQSTLILGEGRSIAYSNGYLYVAEGYRRVNGNRTASNYLHKIRVSTLVNESTYTLDIVPASVTVYKGVLYVTNRQNIYTYDTGTGTLTLIGALPETWQRSDTGGLAFKNFFMDANFYYVLYNNPNIIVRINRSDNAVNYIYNLPTVSPDCYHLGEVASCSYNEDSGVLDIFTAIDLQTANYAQQSAFNHFEANLLHNIYPNLFVGNITPSKYSQLIVDRTTSVLNPDGSENRPFPSLQEAINYACANNYFTNYTIILRNPTGFGFFTTIDTNKTIRIQGTSSGTTIGGIYSWGGNLHLYNLTLACSCATGDTDINACVSLRNANLHIQNCEIYNSTGTSEYYKSVDYGINCYSSSVVYDNLTGQSGHNIIAWANCSNVVEASSGSVTA